MIRTIPQMATGIATPTGPSRTPVHSAVSLLGRWALLGLLLLLGVPASQGQTLSGDYYWTANSDNTVTIVEYVGAGGAVTVPSTISGMTVSEIGTNAFFYQDSITSVFIPGTITTIGPGAFYGCANMASLTISDGVTLLRTNAFGACTALTEVTVPGSVKIVGAYAFYGCTNLAHLTISNGVTKLNTNAFGNCTALTFVDLPASVTNVEDYTFYLCTGITNAIVESGTTIMGGFVFGSCSNLVSATFPGGNFPAGNDFYGCPKLASIIISPGSPFIGADQFANFVTLTSISIADSVTSIGESAFQQCYGLSSVTIPGSVTNIGQNVFIECTNLNTVTMDAGVESIGVTAFAFCSALTNLTIAATVTDIGLEAFDGCSNLTTAVIPNGAANVGVEAFAYCVNLTSATIPGNVADVNYLFYGNPNVSDITISSGTTNIPPYEFNGFSNLVSLTIPGSVASIGDFAFYGSSVSSLTLANGIQSIGDSAFENCTNLRQVTVPGSVATIGAAAFYKCSDLTNIVISNGVQSIGDSAFQYCTLLGNTEIPGSVTNIGAAAFYGDYMITSVVTGSGVRSIGDQAFYFNPSLRSIVINGPVASMGSYVFGVCSNVTTLVISSNVTYIGSNCFVYLPKVHSVSLPASLAFIGEDAFSECYGLTSYYFYGNAPAVSAAGVFKYDRLFARAVAYYLHGKSGWTASFGGAVGSTNTIPTQTWSGGYGSLEVSLTPSTAAAAGALWQVDGGPWQTNGAKVSSLQVGSHLISYSAVPGYLTPANQSVSVSASSTPTKATGTYKGAGYASVAIGPAGVVAAGAEWQIDGGARSTSGATVPLAIGKHTLTFTTVSGWNSPAKQTFTVTNGATNNLSGTYTQQFGSVEVTITPASAIALGAMWQIDGGELHNSGTTVPNISAGAHTLSFTSIGGLAVPTNHTVVVKNKSTSHVPAAYYFAGKGTYNGLFTGAPGTAEQTSGMISGLVVSSTGTYTGKIYVDGSTNSFSGSFIWDAVSTNSTKVIKLPRNGGSLVLNLTGNFASTPLTITGTVSNDIADGWVSYVTNEIAGSGFKSQEYTAAIAPQDTNTPPSGYGCILITNKAGMATLTVAMADGAAFTETIPVSSTTNIPVYGDLYGKTGLVIGWLSLENNDVSGTLTWIRPHSSAALYGTGFTNIVSVTGYPWLNHASTNLTGDLLTIEGASLPSPLSYTMEVSSKDQVTAKDEPSTALKGSITLANGKMAISFGSSSGSAVVLQKPDGTSSVLGYFVTKTNSGSIFSAPQ